MRIQTTDIMSNQINLNELGIKDSGSVEIVTSTTSVRYQSKVKSKFNYDKTVEAKPGVYYWYKGFKGLTEEGLDKCVASRLPQNRWLLDRMWELLNDAGYIGSIEYTDGNVRYAVYPIPMDAYNKLLTQAKEEYLKHRDEAMLRNEVERDARTAKELQGTPDGLEEYAPYLDDPWAGIPPDKEAELRDKGLFDKVAGIRIQKRKLVHKSEQRELDAELTEEGLVRV